MTKQTLKVFCLSECLNDRDPSVTTEVGVEKVGIGNIFNLYWEKVVHIMRQSLQKVNSMFSYLFAQMADCYPIFLEHFNQLWKKVFAEINCKHPCVLILKVEFFQSIQSLQELYLKNISDSLNNLRSQADISIKHIAEQVIVYKFDISKMISQVSTLQSNVSQICQLATSSIATTSLQQGMRPKVIDELKKQFGSLVN